MRSRICMIALLLLGLTLSACSSTPAPDAEATAQAALAATQAAQPTATPVPPTNTPVPPTATPVPPTNTPVPPTNTPVPPTDTPTPTDTPVPPTDTPTPTSTPVPPTNTPAPTDTPVPPTDTPTPAPPTATPTPAISAEEHFEQGLNHFDQEQWAQAVTEFQEVVRIEPAYTIAYKFLGYSCARIDDFEPATAALNKYLQLAPDAADRSEVLATLEEIRLILTIPPGKAMFAFHNYTGEIWVVDIGPYSMNVPANTPDRPYTEVTLVIEPGAYTWQAHSMDNTLYITDAGANRGFDFSVAAGRVHIVRCC